jgi:hypothetical protein
MFLSPEMKQLFYNAYIASSYDYGCIIWSQCNKSDVNKITKLQKRTAGIILNKPLKTNSLDMFQNMKWLSFPSRYKYFSGIMVYKAMNELTPAYISNLIPLSQNKTY